MSKGLFTVIPNKMETICVVEYHNNEEAWSVEFDYQEVRSGWVQITATHLDHTFSSGTRTKRSFPVHVFKEMLKRSINHQQFTDYLMDYHITTNKILGDRYPSTWLTRMYPNGIHDIIRRALIFDLGTKKICRIAWLSCSTPPLELYDM